MQKNVHDKGKAIHCDLCELWIHIKCNNLNYLGCRYLQNCDESWYCIACCSTIFPFNSLSGNKNFWLVVLTLIVTSHSEKIWKMIIIFKPSSNLEHLVNQFNNATPENTNDPEKISSSKYYDIEKMQNIEIPNKNKSQSLFHMNAYSLNKNFDNL